MDKTKPPGRGLIFNESSPVLPQINNDENEDIGDNLSAGSLKFPMYRSVSVPMIITPSKSTPWTRTSAVRSDGEGMDKSGGLNSSQEAVGFNSVVEEEEVLDEESLAKLKEKDAKQRKMTILEIVLTEQDYIKDLGILADMNKHMMEKKILAAEVMAQIFSNIDAIYGVNKNIVEDMNTELRKLDSLEGGREENIHKLPLGKIFAYLAPFLKQNK
jgi:hypothetical protein